MSHQYLFILGNTPALSRLELTAIMPDAEQVEVLESVSLVTTEEPISNLIDILGGTVKIAEVLTELPPQTAESLTQVIAEQVEQLALKDFAVAEVGRDHLPVVDASEIKHILRKKGINTRYVDGSRHGMSAAVLRHQKVTEILTVQTAKTIYLCKTIQVQDVDEWTKRDRQKPYADRKKGMLPPKVARIMVNLALGPNPEPNTVLFDPFCGSGTVLMEALCRGVQVVGSDTDPEAVAGSKANIAWLKYEYGIELDATFLLGDATTVRLPHTIVPSHIVTEPFLGKQTPRLEQLPNIYKGLYKLYLGAFRHWKNLLQDQAKIVCVFPVVLPSPDTKGKQFDLDILIDKLPEFGYTTESEKVMYFRPQAVVARQITQLKLSK